MTYRLHSLNTRTGDRTTGLTVYPEHVARDLAARLNAAPAMVKEGIVYEAVEVKAVPRPGYREYLRGGE